MAYNFHSLSPADFEDLVRDLIGKEIGIRFEAFGPGPDGGIDGRHSKGRKTIVLQAKHYAGSRYTDLKSRMKIERIAMRELRPSRYILATSKTLTPTNKRDLSRILRGFLREPSDIFSATDLNTLLRKHPTIEKSHIKLWLTSTAPLEKILHAAAHSFKQITRTDIEAKLQVYAPNPSFDKARDILEAHHVLIVSGTPGVGKSTLAEMLSYAYAAEGWLLEAIRKLDDGFVAIEDSKKQIFFFDDFLGKVALDRRALAHNDSDLARFIKRVRKSPNARFILTTRANIFEEARSYSEHLADRTLNVAKFVLDVGTYTRRIRARILYNHLIFSDTPKPLVTALVRSGDIPKIVDHRNYNPRIIEWMTDVNRIGEVEPHKYPSAFLAALDNPHELWNIAFRNLSSTCQHLLLTLFFCSEYGVSINKLCDAYEAIHAHLCSRYSEVGGPKDFEDSLRVLEGGFLTISDGTVRFINPSLRDFLTWYLRDSKLLCELALAVRFPDLAQAMWRHRTQLKLSPQHLKKLALSFQPAAECMAHLPTWSERDERGLQFPINLSNPARIELLLEWWTDSEHEAFHEVALKLANDPPGGFSAWRDARDLTELIYQLRDQDYYRPFEGADELSAILEDHLIRSIESGLAADELDNLSDTVEMYESHLGSEVKNAIHQAIQSELDGIDQMVSEMDSAASLKEYVRTVRKFGTKISMPPEILEQNVSFIEARIAEVRDEAVVSEPPSFDTVKSGDKDTFDNEALNNLFAPLLA